MPPLRPNTLVVFLLGGLHSSLRICLGDCRSIYMSVYLPVRLSVCACLAASISRTPPPRLLSLCASLSQTRGLGIPLPLPLKPGAFHRRSVFVPDPLPLQRSELPPGNPPRHGKKPSPHAVPAAITTVGVLAAAIVSARRRRPRRLGRPVLAPGSATSSRPSVFRTSTAFSGSPPPPPLATTAEGGGGGTGLRLSISSVLVLAVAGSIAVPS